MFASFKIDMSPKITEQKLMQILCLLFKWNIVW